MSKDIKVKVSTIGGEEHDIETPIDITVDDFIRELAVALNLPMRDAEGHPINWRLDDIDTGRSLDNQSSFEANKVDDGHRLSLLRQTVAGCFPESAKVLLPSNDTMTIGSIKPRETILTYDPVTKSYLKNEVQGIYLETYSQQVKINGHLVTTPDQHLLLANQGWVLAEHLTKGEQLLSFPFRDVEVTTIERVDALIPMVSLTLKEPLCFIVDGFIVRDFLGKQAKLERAVDVFLSYSVTDKDEARIIFDMLEKEQITVFLAERSIEAGQNWEGSIKEALKNCRNFWLLVTPNSLHSEWVITEWASAWALDKNIVPILFRCKPEDLPLRLRAYQAIDFHRVDRAIKKLVGR